MARRYDTRQVTHQVKTLVELTCDLCGRASPRPGAESWDPDGYEVDEAEVTISVRVKASRGSSYPEGGHVREISADLCPDCVRGKIFPWLEAQGVKLREKEIEW
jgi:hypothetical protein